MASALSCSGYFVSGAGSPAVNGCYRQRTDGHFVLDGGHEMYSWQGTWRLGLRGANVSYVAARPSAWPPITTGGCGADGWIQSGAEAQGADPCPAVKRMLPPAPPVPPPPPVPPLPPVPPPPPMRLVWSDDFDGAALDTKVWNVLEQVHRGGVYTRGNVQVSDGVLRLLTRRENMTIDQGCGRHTNADLLLRACCTAYRGRASVALRM
jgi:hypothetical protein